MEKIENLDFCRKCGGYCCKKSGCDYGVDDFSDLSYKGLLKVLAQGNISIVACLQFSYVNNKMCCSPFLYLRARNEKRDVVDLLSVKTRCSMLKDDGCSYSYEERPRGGRNLIPAEKKELCLPKDSPLEIIREWGNYQKVLSRIVKNYCGMSVDKKLREDVKKLTVRLIRDDLEEAAIEEKIDLYQMFANLVEAFPQEVKEASRIAKQGKNLKLSR